MQEADILANAPAAANSPFSDGWFAIYRRIDNEWLIVAID